jgi:uncharacterized protein
MKNSKYNFYIPYEDNKMIVFNGISKKFILIENTYCNTFKKYINNPNNIPEKSISEQLEKSGFIIEDSMDETTVLLEQRQSFLSFPYYTLMILPTYDCNFRCWYCIQKHNDSYLNHDLIQKIKKHIEKYLIENEISSFEISWFGGEPLLNFDAIVDISEFAIDFCKMHNITYINTMTTNGFLISETIAKKMKDLKFVHFQITIDGCRDKHNKVKYDLNNNESAFDKTLKNIIILLKNISYTNILLRFNCTHDNIDYEIIVDELNKIIPKELRKKITVNIQIVWQINESEIDINNIYNFKYLIAKNGYNLSIADLADMHACYVEREHFNSLLPNGNLVKCNNCDFNKCEGTLSADGAIIWKEHNKYLLKDKCIDCKFIPVCFGGCPEKRFINNSSAVKQKNCTKNKYQFRQIVDYCENVILNEQFNNN